MPRTIPTAASLRSRPRTQTVGAHANHVRSVMTERHNAAREVSERAGNRGFRASEQRAFDEHRTELRALEELLDEIENSSEGREIDRSQILNIGAADDDPHGPGRINSRDAYTAGAPLTRDQTFAGFIRSRGELREGQADLSLRRYLRGMVVGEWEGASNERRAMSEGVLAGGGYLLPSPLSADIIDLARPQTRVLQAGAAIVPMESKTLDIARWEGDPALAWHTEANPIAASDAVLGRIRLEAKALAGRVVFSRELLEDAEGIDAAVREAFAAQLALIVDQAALYGSGTAPEPRGVKNTSGITVQTSGANGAPITSWAPLVESVGALADRNETATGVIYSSRTARMFEGGLFDSTGQPLQPPPYVEDLPRYATTQVPNNLPAGTSTDTSDVFTADWSRLMVGVRTQLELVPLKERYADTGQVGLLAWWRGDIAVQRPGAFHVRTGVRP